MTRAAQPTTPDNGVVAPCPSGAGALATRFPDTAGRKDLGEGVMGEFA